MKFKNILVYIDDSDRSKALLSCAANLARKHDAGLSCLHIYDWTHHVETAKTELWLDRSVATTDMGREKDLKEWFNKSFDKENIKVNWYHEEGEVATYLNIYTRYFDLVLLNKPNSRLTHNLLLNAGRPVLVIPEQYLDKSFANRILIAWSSTHKESARALNDSMPLLLQAEKIDIVKVYEDDHLPIKLEKEKQGILEHLSKYGLQAEMHSFSESPETVGEIVLSQATDNKTDLIVMGGYGHTRFSEIILGGATRHIFKNTVIPLFVSH
jgi:nucleotide-binding universal stress UspA family protein